MAEIKRRLAGTFPAVVLAASFLTAGALADEESYVDNWPGNVRLELATPELPEAIPLPAEQAGDPLSERLRLAWAEKLSRTCELIRAGFEQSGAVREWRSCDLAAAGELRGRALNPSLFPNRLDLKYVVAGNRVRFVAPTPTVLGDWADPVVQAEFSVVIRLTLLFDTRLDLAQLPADGTISLLSGHIGFAGARFTSSLDDIPVASDLIAPSLREGETDLNARMESLLPDMLPLGAMNLELFNKVNGWRITLETEEHRVPYLGLTTFLRENDFVMLLSRGSRPAVALSMCSCGSECDQRIGCTCGGAAVLQEDEQVLLQRLMPGGAWSPSGLSDPGSWSVVGDALGVATGEDVTVRLCTVNQWGRNCGEPLTFVYQHSGSCTSPDPTPTPICPPGMRPCPGHGCLTPSMECAAER